MKLSIGAIAGLAILVAAGPAAFAQQDDLLQRIKDRGTIRVCQAAYPPYNVKNPISGEWEGLNVDLVKEIAASLKVEIENVDNTFATLIASINTDKCDLSAAATYVTPARAEQVLFTDSFSADTKTVFVPKDSSAKTYADIDKPDVVIATRAGTAEAAFAKNFFKQAEIKLITSDATEAHLLEVAAGRADAAFAGYTGGMMFLKSNPNVNLRPLGDARLDASPFAFMLPTGEYHFQQYLNVVLASLERSGKLKQFTDKWFSLSD